MMLVDEILFVTVVLVRIDTDAPDTTDLSAPYAYGEYGGYGFPDVVV